MGQTKGKTTGAITTLSTLLLGLCVLLPLPVNAGTAEGITWLSSQQNTSGSFGATPAALATEPQTTAEVLRSYQSLNQTGVAVFAPALGYLNGTPDSDTELLSRRIVINAKAGNDVSALINTLLLNQHSDGGFGNRAGDSSSVFDTALALEALAASNYTTGTFVSRAVSFLLTQQSTTGGWSDGVNDSAVYPTAQAMRALLPYRTLYQGISPALTKAQTFLLSRRDSLGAFGEPFETALALTALIPIVSDQTQIEQSVISLRTSQSADGSWVGDAYTTALAIEALVLSANPPADPAYGTIRGHVTDATTGVALSGVTIALTGTATRTGQTDSTGLFRFTTLAPGKYGISITLSGYAPVSTETTVVAGSTLDLGAIALVKSSTSTTGTIRGLVTDAATGLPLAGVAVSAGSVTPVITDATGNYQIANVPPGAVTLLAAKSGYTTATGSATIVAGGLFLFSPALFPQSGEVALSGRVVDSATAAPLSGVTVNLTGPVTRNLTTGAGGAFSFSGLPAGSYSIEVILPGYFGATATVSASPGTYNIGDIGLSKDVKITTATLRGTVTDATTGAALAGARVTVNGNQATAITDGMGAYTITGLTVGTAVIQVSNTGYEAAVTSGPIAAGGVFVFSPALIPSGSQRVIIRGIVTNATNGARVSDAVISIGGAATGSTITAGTGSYEFNGLNPGTFTISVSAVGFDTVSATGLVPMGYVLDFSPKLYPSNTSPPDANTAGVVGVVVDAGTNQPLIGAAVAVTIGTTQRSVVTGSDGSFSLKGFTGGIVDASVSFAGYTTTNTSFLLEPLKTTDVGQVRMRRSDAATLLPDLAVDNVVTAGVMVDPQTLAVTGALNATVTNGGTANAARTFIVLAYQDTNRNGVFDDADVVFGSTSVNGLAAGQSQSFSIAVNGTAGFRDAPIAVWVDSDQVVPERNETNNRQTTASTCQIKPSIGTFEPQVKWSWTGSSVLPAYDQVISTPLVVLLEDTNGDGQIDVNDIPAIVFATFQGSNYGRDGVLRAVSGRDGRELWTVTSTTLRLSGLANLAAADIDGDGVVEILAGAGNNGTLAFEHTGAVKWTSSYPAYLNWGAIAVADLDGDGRPEIIVGNTVLNADGTLRWQGSGYVGSPSKGLISGSQSPVSIVADVNLDGVPEIVAGAAAYRAGGTRLWQNTTVGDGFTAVGNFDSSPYPEIAVVANGKVFMLDYNGTILWGPVALPGGGAGGAPTVADMDGDGVPEIGVAGGGAYTVFRADGSILWMAPTQDISSNQTGSSVFDFDGDGTAEVVYGDELRLRVFRGRDGVILFDIPNTSGTWFEIPVVADVDGDGHADLVVAANRLNKSAGLAGIRVFQDKNNSWVNTRKIWNQHSYHITNVNDDGTIPRVEQNSWQGHNTYRLNAFPDRSGTGTPDLTAGRLQLVATAGGATLTARIGNAGAESAPAGAIVRFFEGDPAANGRVLGETTLPALAPGEYRDIAVNLTTSLTGTADLYVTADATNRISECRENNNTTHAPAVPGTVVGTIAVITDKAAYSAAETAILSATIANTSALVSDFTAKLQIEDATGNLVTAFAPQPVTALAGGATRDIQATWNTGTTLAGNYTLRGTLYSTAGEKISESVAGFTLASSGSIPAVKASLRLNTDRPVYYTTDNVSIRSLIGNTTINAILNDVNLTIRVRAPDGTVVFSNTGILGQFLPSALRELLLPYALRNVPVAVYQVEGELTSGGVELATATTQFEVRYDLAKALTGKVEAALSTLEAGRPQICTDTLTNAGPIPIADAEIHRVLLNIDSQQLLADVTGNLNLAVGANNVQSRSLATTGLAAGHYACALQVRIGNDLKTLGYAAFTVTVPPIKIDATLNASTKGRLLVLLDAPHCAGKGDHDHKQGNDENKNCGCDQNADNHKLSAQTTQPVANNTVGTSCDNGQPHPKPCNQDQDPHGPKTAPTLSAQKSFLENLLKAQGLSYTLTESAETFTKEFHTGGYTQYAIFAEQEKLPEQTQKELREAVFSGQGLLVAGSHDARHHGLLDTLGIKLIGQVDNAHAAELTDNPFTLSGRVSILNADKALRLKRTTAQSIAYYVPGGRTRDRHPDDEPDCCDHGRRFKDREQGLNVKDRDEQDECHGHPDAHRDAAVLNTYGQGHSAFAGFDLLAIATKEGNTSLSAKVLKALLGHTSATTLTPVAHTVQPLELTLTNRGIATTATATVTLPTGAQVLDAGTGSATAQTLTFTTALALNEEKTLRFWVRLPANEGPATFDATVMAGNPATVITTAQYTVNVTAPTLGAVKTGLEELLNQKTKHRKDLKQALEHINHAYNNFHPDKAIPHVLNATDALASLTDPVIVEIRLALDAWLRYAGTMVR